MSMQLYAVLLLWLLWLVFWSVSARFTKPTRWEEARGSRRAHLMFSLAAAWLLCLPQLLPPALRAWIIPYSSGLAWWGVVIVVVSLGYSVWARVHLGRNWSAAVAVKQDHELVRSGPYRHVRHPIYTGMILALAGTTIALDQWRAPLSLALITFALVRKLRQEEKRMGEIFPEYAEYRKTSAALLPYIY